MSLKNFISAPCFYETPAHMFVLQIRDQFAVSLLPLHEIVSRLDRVPPRLAPHRVMHASYQRNESHTETAHDLFLHLQENACWLTASDIFVS
jgi:hypothetical protein